MKLLIIPLLLGDKWGIGRKNLNNGVLMLIAKNDRKVLSQQGKGLEGVLPDAFLSQVIRSAILPQFKQGQYAQGINDGLNQIIAASKGEFDAAQVEEDAFDKYIPILNGIWHLLLLYYLVNSNITKMKYILARINVTN